MNRSLRSPCLVRIGVLTAVLASGSVAIAATGDPLSAAQGSADGALAILATYGPVIGGMYLLYTLASAFLARYRSSGWMAQGKRLAITTGALGVAGAALQAQIAGSPWTLVIAAAVAAAFKLLTPTVTPATPAPAAPRSKTVSPIVTMLLLAMVACAGNQRVAAGVTAGLECEAPNIQSAVTQLLPALIKLIGTALRGDGTFDRGILQAIAQPFRATEFQCAMDAAIAAASGSAPATIPASRAVTATGVQLRGTWTEVRSDLGWLPHSSSAPAPAP